MDPHGLARTTTDGHGRSRVRRMALAAVASLALATACSAQVAFPRATLEIVTTGGAVHPFTVEVARTPTQRSRGLMYRTHLAPDAGMLFFYPTPQRARMWMKDTPLSLDMLFVGADGRVLEVAANTEPLSLATIASTDPVLAVLELPGGRAAELSITPGARLKHPTFKASPSP